MRLFQKKVTKSKMRGSAAGTMMLLMLASSQMKAQTTNASLSGTVTDATGAVVPGAAVTALNTGTGLTSKAEVSGSGTYTLPNLPPGTYTVTVTKDGFRTSVQSDVVLSVSETATLKATLSVGETVETVNVDAAPQLINESTADISELVNEHAIKELPLNGRDPSSLVLLAPGTTNVLNRGGKLQAVNSIPTETGASANGGRQGSTYYLLDGVQNMDTYLLLDAPFPNADATQEFRVITNNYDARYGFAPGAVVTIQTKSGTNAIHGAFFEFLRNNDLNAGNYFTHAVDPLKRSQFGAAIGGPIKKDKLFFFANYQGTRATTTAATRTTDDPTTAFLAGDFSALTTNLKNPAFAPGVITTVNGKKNQINPALFSPAAVAISKLIPLGLTPATGLVNYGGTPTSSTYNEATGRLDYEINANQRFTVRSFVDQFDQAAASIPGNILTDTLGVRGRVYNDLVSHTWTLSPTSINILSGAWLENDTFSAAQVTNSAGQPVCLSQFIAVSDPAGGCYPQNGFSVTNGPSQVQSSPNRENRRTWTINDDFSKSIGQHVITVGGNLLHQYASEVSAYPSNAGVKFSGQYTGFGIADFLLGYGSTFLQGSGEVQNPSGKVIGIYAQDAWRIKPNLTLTYGVRWEPDTPPSVSSGRGAAFIPGQQSTRYPGAPVGLVFPGDTGVTSSLFPSDYTDFQPRIGVAFQPKSLPNTAIRAAFGMFFTPLEYSLYNHTADLFPFDPTYSFSGTATQDIPFQTPYAYANSGVAGGVNPFPPFPITANPPSNAAFPSSAISLGSVFSRNFKLGATQSWNLSVEQQLARSLALHLAYVASESYHQNTPIDQNPGLASLGGARALSKFSFIDQNTSNGTASYQSLQVGLEKRLSYGLQFQSNFTWSKTIDTYSNASVSFAPAPLPNPFNLGYNRGISDLNTPFISVTNFIYTTPSFRSHNAFIREALGAYEITGITTLESGVAFSVSGGSGNNNSESQQNADFANFAVGSNSALARSSLRQGSKTQQLTRYFNTAAFVPNPVGTFGNTPRNLFQGPGLNSTDLGLIKNFAYGERYNLQFRWEMFNAFNHPNFGLPNTTVGNGSFGQITTVGSIPPRVQQAALKLTF